jgi:hypothetical protein
MNAKYIITKHPIHGLRCGIYAYLLIINSEEAAFAIYIHLLIITHFSTQDGKFRALYKFIGMTL